LQAYIIINKMEGQKFKSKLQQANIKQIHCKQTGAKIRQHFSVFVIFLVYSVFLLTLRQQKLNFWQKYSENFTGFPGSKKLSEPTLVTGTYMKRENTNWKDFK
jgi:hypothetical protein